MALPDHLWPQYSQIWAVDFEFRPVAGELPEVVCMVARELRSGERTRLWRDDLQQRVTPPYPIERGDVLVASYYATAEIGCHMALGWPAPKNVLDLWVEFKNFVNGRQVSGLSLLNALQAFGLRGIDAAEKEDMRQLILERDHWAANEQRAILDYCESDVVALQELLPRMAPHIDLPRALLRGRFMSCVSIMEKIGIPTDVATYLRLVNNWDAIKRQLIDAVDSLGIYEGQTFKMAHWAREMDRLGIPWPRLGGGGLALDDETFRQMARTHGGAVALYHELRHTLSALRLNNLEIGSDGRNRTNLRPFASRTGRNQPSNSKSLFGPATWIRGLIRPDPGRAVAYLDFGKQELAIAAVLSGDPAMQKDYLAGDPYLAFGKAIGMVPENATKRSHPIERDIFKTVCLGVQYGLTPFGLARKLGVMPQRAAQLLQFHKERYQTFWDWSDAAVAKARLTGFLQTPLGWRRWYREVESDRSIRNFMVQATGADILRLAVILTIEDGISVCAPVHDALLIEADAIDIDEAVERARQHMRRAGEIILNGFPLDVDANVVRGPDRYMDVRGREMWGHIWSLIGKLEQAA